MFRLRLIIISCSLAVTLGCSGAFSVSGNGGGSDSETAPTIHVNEPGDGVTDGGADGTTTGSAEDATGPSWAGNDEPITLREGNNATVNLAELFQNDEPVTFEIDFANSTCPQSDRLSVDQDAGLLSGLFDFETSADCVIAVVAVTESGERFPTTIVINVEDEDEPPTFSDPTISQTVPENSALALTVAALDPDAGATISYAIADGSNCPGIPDLAVNNSSGQLTGMPNFELGTNCIFSVIASSTQHSASQDYNLTISDADDTPRSTIPENLAATEDAPFSIPLPVSDEDGDSLSVVIAPGRTTCNPAHFSAALNIAGSFSLEGTANNDAVGGCTVAFDVSAGGVTIQSDVLLTVTNVNDAPVAADDTPNVPEDYATMIDVFANDSDVDVGDAYSISLIAPFATQGVASVVAGQIQYTPNPDYTGADALTYRVTDAAGSFDDATVNITVDPVAPFEVSGIGGTAHSVEVIGDYLFVCRGYRGLAVLDRTISPPPIVVEMQTDGFCFGTARFGLNHLVIADVWNGILMVDITNPTAPTIVDQHTTPDWAYRVDTAGSTIYAAVNGSGMEVIDGTDPTDLQSIRTFATADNALDVAVEGSYAVVSASTAGIYVVDVSDPATSLPQHRAYDTAGSAYSSVLEGNRVYVSDFGNGVIVLDITNPSVTQVGAQPLPGNANHLTKSGTTLASANFDGGLHLIELTDPDTPVLRTTIPAQHETYGSDIVGDTLYIAEITQGISVVDITNINAPGVPVERRFAGESYVGKAVGNYLYVGDVNIGLNIVDISDPLSPVLVGATPAPAADFVGFSVDVAGDTLFQGGWDSGCHIYDVTDRSNPTLEGTYDLAGNPCAGVHWDGTNLWAAFGNAGIRALDVSDPMAVTVDGTVNLSGEVYHIRRVGNVLYAAEGSVGFSVYDVTNLGAISRDRVRNTAGSARNFDLDATHAYVVSDTGGLYVYDITTPATMFQVGTMPAPSDLRTIRKVGDYVYMTDYDNGIVVADVSDPTMPLKVTEYTVDNRAYDLEIVGNLGFAMQSWGGIIAWGGLPGLGAAPIPPP